MHAAGPPGTSPRKRTMTDSGTAQHKGEAPKQLLFSVMTVSDTRQLDTDRSGQLIVDRLTQAGHTMLERVIVRDEQLDIANQAVQLLSQSPDVLLLTGGTGISSRDVTPEAIEPLIDVPIPGFGELFRMLSYEEIGAAAVLSRALGGRAGSSLVFCLPGSTNAVRLAVDKLLIPELPHLVYHAR